MKITAIKAQVKNPERVSVYIDGKYSFSLSLDQVLTSKVKLGLDLSDSDLQDLKKLSDDGKLYARVLNYATLRPRSVREVYDYLRRKKVEPAMAEKVVARLMDRGYINDATFARVWVQSRTLGKATSLRKIRLELKQKGVSDQIINDALSGYDNNEALNKIIAKKQKLTRYQDPQKLMQYLAGQGFSYDEIKQALNND